MGDERASDFKGYRRRTLGLDRLPPASRANDLPTAKAAGNSFEKRGLSELHARILAWLKAAPMTDEDLERLHEFKYLAPSTVRKRRSELYQLGRIHQVGTRFNTRNRPMGVWGVAQ
jgi:hypothetical protein